MKTIFASLAIFAASALAQFTINTPSNVVECQPTLLSWSGGTAPYFLSILPGNTPNGAAIESLPQTNGTSLTWVCNIASGTYIGFTVRDGTGAVAQSAPVTVNLGSSTSCTNVTSVAGGSATAASTPAASAGATTTPGNSAGTTASASPSSTSASSSGASANVAQLGAAGIAGVAVAALFL